MSDNSTASARYFDGIKADAQHVILSCSSDALLIQSIDRQGLLDEWDISDLTAAGPILPHEISLRKSKQAAARLVIEDPATIELIRHVRPDFWPKHTSHKSRFLMNFGLLTLGISSIAAVFYALPILAWLITPLIPTELERSWGEHLVKGFAPPENRCSSGPARMALKELTARLAPHVTMPFPLHVHVLNEEAVYGKSIENAFALPGGQMVIFNGLLQNAKTPEELAGIMAHELAHLQERHVMQRVIEGAGLALVLNVFLGDVSGITGAAGALAATSYSREKEREADKIGLAILRNAKISPQGFADFFERQHKAHGFLEETLGFLSTHPTSKSRIELALKQTYPFTPLLSDSEWQKLKDICGRKQKRSPKN